MSFGVLVLSEFSGSVDNGWIFERYTVYLQLEIHPFFPLNHDYGRKGKILVLKKK